MDVSSPCFFTKNPSVKRLKSHLRVIHKGNKNRDRIHSESGLLYAGQTLSRTYKVKAIPVSLVNLGNHSPCASIKSSHREIMSSMDNSAAVCGSSIAA